MKTKIIIRIEHPEDGIGIFMSRNIGTSLNNNNEYSHLSDVVNTFDYSVYDIGNVYDKHCAMSSARNIEGFVKGKHYCAYPSVEVMKQWINCSEIKLLLKYGFIVLILDVTDYIKHVDQVLYTKQSIVSSKDISFLFL